LNSHFVQNGVPVVIGECGATNKNNLEAREQWYRYYFETAKANGLTAFIWDNGSVEVGENGDVSEHYGFYNRTEQTFYFPTLLKAALDGIDAATK
ncbi:MAG: cellulase family glycosylhydrolase, partial [Spirochaetaceae bacterium]|nr:cellulase family glycosylhydrolase [Spirochaetaceae bacterium]